MNQTCCWPSSCPLTIQGRLPPPHRPHLRVRQPRVAPAGLARRSLFRPEVSSGLGARSISWRERFWSEAFQCASPANALAGDDEGGGLRCMGPTFKESPRRDDYNLPAQGPLTDRSVWDRDHGG